MPDYRRDGDGRCVASWSRWAGSGGTPAEALDDLLRTMAAEIERLTYPSHTIDPTNTPLSPADLKGMLVR